MNIILILIWLGLLVEIVVLSAIQPLFIDFEIVSIIAVALHVIYTLVILMAYKNSYAPIFVGSFIARLSFMLWDVYASHIYSLPNSGYDSNAFIGSAVMISEDLSLLSETIRGGLYAKYNGILYNLIGFQQLFGQYLNVLLGLTVVFIIYKILLLLDIKSRTIKFALLLVAFFPNTLVMSAIFLREMVISFFVIWSLFYFIRWFKKRLYIDMFLSIMLIGIASTFHSGVSSIFIAYAIIYILYNHKIKAYSIHGSSVPIFLIMIFIAAISILAFDDLLLDTFKNPSGTIEVFETSDYEYAHSMYLTNMTVNNILQLIVFGPIRAFFFLTSPLPIDWRGLMDVFSFFYDSLLYLGTILYFIVNRQRLNDRKVLAYGLVLILISASLVFGIGVSNAGTAIRHRHKILSIFIVLLAVIMDGKSSEEIIVKPSDNWAG